MVTLKQYSNLENKEEIDFAFRYSKIWNEPIDVFEVGSLNNQNFGFVKDIQYDLEKGFDLIKGIEYYIRLGIKKIENKSMEEICQAFNFLISEIKRINEIEEMLLTGTVKNDLIEAGMDELNELGVYLQIRQLALTFHLTIEQVKQMKYDDCLLELVTQKRLSDFEDRVNELRKIKKDT